MVNSSSSSKTKRTTKKAMATSLGISRGMLYYKHLQEQKDQKIKKDIFDVLLANPYYGHKRVAMYLGIGKNRALRIMKKYGLKPLGKRRKFGKPDDQNKPDCGIPNLIKHFCPIRPNIVWVGDFTYLSFHDKLYYLATVMDLFTREVLGWSFSDHHNAELVVAAFSEAKKKLQTTPAYCHSDQGSEYDSYKYKDLIKSHKTQVSMSKKASPWENGYQESFYSNYKKELDTKNLNRFDSLGELVEAVALQLYYYNNDRIHTSLKTSPVKFKNNLTIQKVFKETGT